MTNEISPETITEKIILIDTNIWHYAYFDDVLPQYEEIHKKAKKFLDKKLEDPFCFIALSLYQVGEIIELFRKAKIDKEERRKLFKSFQENKFILRNLTENIIEEAVEKSINSDIHIYDYFVALPVKDIITEIYSADDHLQHKDFTSICEVINPLQPWILREGRKPEKK